MSQPERPTWLTTFLRRLNGEGARSVVLASRDR
jgi:hypothetical protein